MKNLCKLNKIIEQFSHVYSVQLISRSRSEQREKSDI